MSIIRWDPFDDLASLRESMDKLFEDFFTRRPRGEAVTAWQPAVEMFETDSDIVVRADLPGIDPKHVDITVTDDTLTLKGEAKAEHEDRGRNYVRRELRYGSFIRTLALPDGVKRQAILNPENTVYSIKRFMGRRYSEVETERKMVPYKVEEGGNGMAVARLPAAGKVFTPEEISAMILQKMKADAEAYLGEPVAEAVITVPAYFNDAQRTATKNAGEIAGLKVLRIINQPFITADANGPKHLDYVLTRAKFDEMTADLVERCIGPFKQALADAKMTEKDLDEVILVGGATRMPMVQELVRRLTGKEPSKEVHPDEVVAVGAAIQAGVLAGTVREVVLLDVTPLSLGVETLGGVMTPLIPRNTTIPTRKSEVFTTAADGQTQVEIHVLQGERQMARDSRTLGRFILDGLPPAPRGVPKIEVTFDIDANGILDAKAKDTATSREQSIKITGTSTLAKDDVEKMVKEAERYAEEDKRRREVAETRNRGDSLAYQTERMLHEVGDKISADERQKVEAKLKDLKDALSGEDVARINRAADELQQASFKLAEAMYSKAGAGGGKGADGPAGPAGAAKPGDEVIDADYKRTDEKP